jgi:hypothetical protein
MRAGNLLTFMSRAGGACIESSLQSTRNRSIIADAMNSRPLVIASSLSLVIFAWVGLFSAGVPKVYCPLPMLTLLPAIRLDGPRLILVALLIPSVLFIAWSPSLLKCGYTKLPKRTAVLTSVLSVVTVFYFTAHWKYGLEYRGKEHTIIVFLMNVIWLAMLWWAIIRALRQPSFRAILLSHWLLFAWLSWYAFPYLGELP